MSVYKMPSVTDNPNMARAERLRSFADYLENREMQKAIKEYTFMDEDTQQLVEAILERFVNSKQ